MFRWPLAEGARRAPTLWGGARNRPGPHKTSPEGTAAARFCMIVRYLSALRGIWRKIHYGLSQCISRTSTITRFCVNYHEPTLACSIFFISLASDPHTKLGRGFHRWQYHRILTEGPDEQANEQGTPDGRRSLLIYLYKIWSKSIFF